jgi:hypothetical protein
LRDFKVGASEFPDNSRVARALRKDDGRPWIAFIEHPGDELHSTQYETKIEVTNMKLSKSLAIAGIALSLASGSVLAQNDGGNGGGPGGGRRGNFDPAQMQQRMMDNLKEQMAVTDEAEWKVIQERAQKVMDARRDVGFGGPRMGRRNNNNNEGGGQRRGGMFGAPSPELESLQTAIDNNAPAEQVKSALEKYRASQKNKEAALEKAQAELKKVLTSKQEAVAVVNGLLK